VKHIFSSERLEIEPVGGVVIRAHGFRVGVYHYAFHAHFRKGKAGVHAAVVKLYALAYAVRPASQNHHLLCLGVAHLVLLLVGAVIIWRVGRELGRAGIHRLIDRVSLVLLPQCGNLALAYAPQKGKLAV